MVIWTYAYYSLASWLIPTALGVLTGVILCVLPKKPYLFLVDRLLGICQCDSDSPTPAKENPVTVTPVEYVDEETKIDVLQEKVVLEKSLWWRFFIWLLTGLTLSLSWTIIFNTIFLATDRVIAGEACPDYFADCFVFPAFLNFTPVGPYNCTPNQLANFPMDGSIVCFGWVIGSQGMNDLLEVLGTCGGLLGLVGSIVPFIYYLSYNLKCFPCSIAYGFVTAFVAIGAVVTLYIFKIGISLLTWFVLLLTAGLSVLASVLACTRICEKKRAEKQILRRKSSARTTIGSPNTVIRQPVAVSTVNKQEQRRGDIARAVTAWD